MRMRRLDKRFLEWSRTDDNPAVQIVNTIEVSEEDARHKRQLTYDLCMGDLKFAEFMGKCDVLNSLDQTALAVIDIHFFFQMVDAKRLLIGGDERRI